MWEQNENLYSSHRAIKPLCRHILKSKFSYLQPVSQSVGFDGFLQERPRKPMVFYKRVCI